MADAEKDAVKPSAPAPAEVPPSMRALDTKVKELSEVLEKLTLPAVEALSRRVGELEKTWAHAQSYLKSKGIVIPPVGDAQAPAAAPGKAKRSLLGRLIAGGDDE